MIGAFQKGEHFLEVSVEHDSERVFTKIIGSRSLDRSDGKIHHAAHDWIDELEWRIRRNLEAMAGHVPAAPSPL